MRSCGHPATSPRAEPWPPARPPASLGDCAPGRARRGRRPACPRSAGGLGTQDAGGADQVAASRGGTGRRGRRKAQQTASFGPQEQGPESGRVARGGRVLPIQSQFPSSLAAWAAGGGASLGSGDAGLPERRRGTARRQRWGGGGGGGEGRKRASVVLSPKISFSVDPSLLTSLAPSLRVSVPPFYPPVPHPSAPLPGTPGSP